MSLLTAWSHVKKGSYNSTRLWTWGVSIPFGRFAPVQIVFPAHCVVDEWAPLLVGTDRTKEKHVHLLPLSGFELRFFGHTLCSVVYSYHTVPAPSLLKYITETVISVCIKSNYVHKMESLNCRPTNTWILKFNWASRNCITKGSELIRSSDVINYSPAFFHQLIVIPVFSRRDMNSPQYRK